jgi:tRNA pseudouridine55 synthase
MDGVINLDKPAGMSSARAVTRVKHMLPKGVKIGHAGTLDPFATGVLVLLIGRATKLCETLMSQPKQYEATIKLGATTETLDPTSPEVVTEGAAAVPREAVEGVLGRFVGEIEQMPPVYSALKIAGRPAYELARKGQAVELKARRVRVYGMELMEYGWPELRVRIDCGRGTYVRALARDIGAALGVGGYVTALRRTRVGEQYIGSAVTLERLAAEGVEGHIVQIA